METNNTPSPKIYAFVSYSHKDVRTAKWLQHRLESFKLPTEIHNEIDAANRYLRPVMRDQTDFNTGILSDEIFQHLEQSKFLIIICSRNSASSKWVSSEAEAFVRMGRLDRIIPVIIPDGHTPERDLFPVFLRDYFANHPGSELLGVNIGEIGKSRAIIRVVSKMLGVSFDSLWNRHRQQQRRKRLLWSAGIAAAAAILYLAAWPVTLSLNIGMQSARLPGPEHVALSIDGANRMAPASAPRFRDIRIPGYRRFSPVRFKVSAQYFNTLDTVVTPGLGVKKNIAATLSRDNTFAVYGGEVYDPDMNPLEGVAVKVGDQSAVTDIRGRFSISIPLSAQRPALPLSLSKQGYRSLQRADEVPSPEIRHILYPL